MISFKQAQDVLDYARDFHHQLADYYRKLNSTTDRQRIRMLLDYLILHEQELESNITRIESAMSGKISRTWFKYTLCEDLRTELKDVVFLPEELSVEELIRRAIALDDCLIRIYKKIAANTDVPEVREIFNNLSELEDHEKRRFVMDSTRMYDM